MGAHDFTSRAIYYLLAFLKFALWLGPCTIYVLIYFMPLGNYPAALLKKEKKHWCM
jgi:hypothetical protein